MMIRLILLSLLLFKFDASFSQKTIVDSLTDIRINEIRLSDSSIIIRVHEGFSGRSTGFYFDKKYSGIICDKSPIDVSHLFWIDKDKVYLQRIDACGYFKPICIETDLYNFHNPNKKEIEKKLKRQKMRAHSFYNTVLIINRDSSIKIYLQNDNLVDRRLKRKKQIIFVKMINEIINEKVEENQFKRENEQ